jgi:hypothetical protein
VVAARRADGWLRRTLSANPEAEALRQLGLCFSKHVSGSAGGWQPLAGDPIALPSLADFVTMDRGHLRTLLERISLVAMSSSRARASYRERWGQCFGGVALSYARMNDASVVAVLVRAAAHLHLRSTWLYEAEEYLLDQQQPEGYFGLLALESALLDKGPAAEAILRLTVEVLWALAETTTLERSEADPLLGTAACDLRR